MNLKNPILPRHNLIALIIILGSLLLKAFYIYTYTHYADSLYSDMGGYWNGGLERSAGQTHQVSHYAIFPPFYMYVLGYFMSLMKTLGLFAYTLKITILCNLILHSISVYYLYLMIYPLVQRKIFAFLALSVYAFSYIATYINALVMPENLAIPLLIICIRFITQDQLSWIKACLLGLFLGIIVSAKPLMIIICPLFAYLVFKKALQKKTLELMILFITTILLIPVGTIYENYRISDGKLFGISPVGGLNFFAGWTDTGKIVSESSAGYWWICNTSFLDGSSLKPFYTKEPFYHQSYFYNLGFKTIVESPNLLIEKILHFKRFFYSIIIPSHRTEPYGHDFMMKIIQIFVLIMFSVVVFFFVFFRKYACAGASLFFYQFLFLFFLGSYLIAIPERRYFFFIEFLVIILCFIAIDQIYALYKNNPKS